MINNSQNKAVQNEPKKCNVVGFHCTDLLSSRMFQTPVPVCKYMASFLPFNAGTILEPTPGEGNIVNAVQPHGTVIAPEHFEDIPCDSRFDWVVMNPPFTPMKEGYRYLSAVMSMSDNIIALLPWFILINSQRRLDSIMQFGLKSVTALPRKTFPGSRIQCCILEIRKGWTGTTFRSFDWE